MASIDVTGVSSEYFNGAELEKAGVPITGPRAELEGILREQGATPVERLLSPTDAGEAPGPSWRDWRVPELGPGTVRAQTSQEAAEALVKLHSIAPGLGFDVELVGSAGSWPWRFFAMPDGGAMSGECLPPDPKREALEKRARAYEASGRMRRVAYGAKPDPPPTESATAKLTRKLEDIAVCSSTDERMRLLSEALRLLPDVAEQQKAAYAHTVRPVTLEEERRAVEEHAERVRSAPINVAKAALRAVAEASTPAGQMAAIDRVFEAIDEACVDAFRQGAAEARQEASKAPPFVCSSADIAYLAVVGAMHEVHLATRDLTPPVAINPTTYTGEPHADKIEGLRDHARRLIAALDAWEGLTS
jgi:hypothetical protein